jgi:hypothetical protein
MGELAQDGAGWEALSPAIKTAAATDNLRYGDIRNSG